MSPVLEFRFRVARVAGAFPDPASSFGDFAGVGPRPIGDRDMSLSITGFGVRGSRAGPTRALEEVEVGGDGPVGLMTAGLAREGGRTEDMEREL